MCKSYDTVIPLFATSDQLRRTIAGIVTDSRAPGEAKTTEGSALFQIFEAFASPEETAALAKAYAEGIAWGDAKKIVHERIDREMTPLRERYEALISRPERIEDILMAGAEKARRIATPFTQRLRHSVGLRRLGTAPAAAGAGPAKARPAAGGFKQYREADGRFYFKLVDIQGRLVLQSSAFDSPRDAANVIANLRTGVADEQALTAHAALGAGVTVADALATLRQLAGST